MLLAKQIGIKEIVVFLNFVDILKAQNDNETLELVELEVRELLTYYGFDGKTVPIISGMTAPLSILFRSVSHWRMIFGDTFQPCSVLKILLLDASRKFF